MKVAVSIPDPIFADAELLARRLNSSRSELYARALRAFVSTHQSDRITEALNAVVDEVGGGVDESTRVAARRIHDRLEW